MKKSRFTETQIVGILKEAEGGIAMADILRTHGISGATFYKWRSKYWTDLIFSTTPKERIFDNLSP